MRRALAALLLVSVLRASAQTDEHPFLSAYSLQVQEGRVMVQWVMQGGSTCDGSSVERSTDGAHFIPVHRIEGLCGDPEVAVPFSWSDAEPPELSTLYYRIAFANEGRSSVKSIRFEQLNRSSLRLYPSPTDGLSTLLLRVPQSAQVDLRVFDAHGRQVMERLQQLGRSHPLDLSPFAAGVYQVVAIADGERFEARVVKR